MNIEDRIIGGFSFEGADRVGKATQARVTLETLIGAEQMEINGKLYRTGGEGDTVIMQGDFPQYSLPTGYMIRLMNRGGIDEYFQHIGVAPDMDEEMHLRMGMYSLDRLLGILGFWSAALEIPSDKKIFFYSDRGPYSQIVTITGVLEKYGSLDKLEEYLDLVLAGDSFIRDILPWDPVVLTKTKDSRATSKDIELDFLEKKEVQSSTTEAYLMYSKKHNLPVVAVNSSVNGQWRDPLDINKEVLKAAGIGIDYDGEWIHKPIDRQLLYAIRREAYKFLGPATFARNAYSHVEHNSKKHHFDSMAVHYTEGGVLYDRWLDAYFSFDSDDGENRITDRKARLDKMDYMFARINAALFYNGHPSTRVLNILPRGYFAQGKFLLGEFTSGHLYPFVRFMERKYRIYSGLSRFIHNTFKYE